MTTMGSPQRKPSNGSASSQLERDLSLSICENLSVSRDIFDFDDLLAPVMDAKPKRSVSASWNTSAAGSLNQFKPKHVPLQAGGSSNFRFGHIMMSQQQGSVPHNRGTSTPDVSSSSFARCFSARNVSDLQRSRQKPSSLSLSSSSHSPFEHLKNLAQQRLLEIRMRRGGKGNVQVASVLRAPSNSNLPLVDNHTVTAVGNGNATTTTNTTTEKRSASDAFQLVLPQQQQQQQQPSSFKKMKTQESALHRACCQPGITALKIYSLVKCDPSAVSRPEQVYSNKMVYDHGLKTMVPKMVKEPYTLPLNLAISHRQSSQVLNILMNLAPSVLTTPDGREKEGSLSILFKYSPQDTDTVDRMLLLTPKCVALRDRHGNSPAHIACTRHSSLDAVRHVAIMYPESLRMRNVHGKTPLGVASQYTQSCSEAICNFLWEQQEQQQQQQQHALGVEKPLAPLPRFHQNNNNNNSNSSYSSINSNNSNVSSNNISR